MYDLPDLREATDAWWSGLARALRSEGIEDVPEALVRTPNSEDVWSSDELLLSQTCGYSMVTRWRGRLTYVATPCYKARGCHGPLYSSVILVPAASQAQTLEELRGLRCVINGYGSHSGCNALRATIASLARDGRFFGSVVVSGSHAQSIAMLERGEADATAIDCVVYALLTRFRSELSDSVRIVGRTVSAPVGPYVTRRDVPEDLVRQLQRGLARAIEDPDLAAARQALLLDRFEIIPSERYDDMTRLEREASECGYSDFKQ